MISATEAEELIDDLFEEEALVLGGMVAVHRLDDEIVWGLVRSFDTIRGRFLRRLRETVTDDSNVSQQDVQRHPAIQDFLNSLRRA